MLLRNHNIVEQIIEKHIQLLDLEKHWPDNPVSVSSKGIICIKGTYKQPYFKNEYKYVLGYSLLDGNVKVFIVEPQIVKTKFNHINNDGSLCIYHYRDYSIHKRFLIGSEIIAWTIDWIFSHEEYLVNGNIWKGKEADHG